MGQLPPARRHRDLRRAGAHGAGLLAALPAGRRPRQLRLARRRRRGGHALHRVPAAGARGRAARASSARRPSTSARTTTARGSSRSCCRRASRTCSSTAPPASRSAWRRTSRRTTSARWSTRCIALIDDPRARDQGPAQAHQGPRLPDRRPDAQQQGRAARDLRDGPGHGQAARRVEARGAASAAAQHDRHHVDPVRGEQVDAGREDRRGDHASASCRTLLDVRDESTDGRAHRARDQEGRRSRAGDGVPLQAHAAADELQRQPDLPRARPRTRRSARPQRLDLQGDAPALPRLPLRGGDASASSSSSSSCRARIHILEGFAKVFDALDEMIRIIRKRDGKEDAAQKLIEALQARRRAGRRDPRAEALQAGAARDPGDPRRSWRRSAPRPSALEELLKSDAEAAGTWSATSSRELADDATATSAGPRSAARREEVEFDAEAFIVDEDANVVLTRDGWIKRVRELKDPTPTRAARGRRGDAHVLAGSTKSSARRSSPTRPAYVHRINDMPATTGYGDPGAEALQVRRRRAHRRARSRSIRALPPAARSCSAVSQRRATACASRSRRTPSSRRAPAAATRKPSEGDELIGVRPVQRRRTCSRVVTRDGHALVCKADEINELAGPGRGVTRDQGRRRRSGDRLPLHARQGRRARRSRPRRARSSSSHADPKQVGARGGKGRQIVKKDDAASRCRTPRASRAARRRRRRKE